jgi:hypothetical protein
MQVAFMMATHCLMKLFSISFPNANWFNKNPCERRGLRQPILAFHILIGNLIAYQPTNCFCYLFNYKPYTKMFVIINSSFIILAGKIHRFIMQYCNIIFIYSPLDGNPLPWWWAGSSASWHYKVILQYIRAYKITYIYLTDQWQVTETNNTI